MTEYDFQQINYELKKIRSNLVKTKNSEKEEELKNRYSELRNIYKNRFDDFSKIELFDEYDKILDRINDLEKRYEKSNNLKIKFCDFYRRKRAKKISFKIKEELDRRYRALNDLLNEIEKDRGMVLESIFLNGCEYSN